MKEKRRYDRVKGSITEFQVSRAPEGSEGGVTDREERARTLLNVSGRDGEIQSNRAEAKHISAIGS